MAKNSKTLDLKKIKGKRSLVMTSKEALCDIIPFNWSDDVIAGKRKVIIKL